MRFGDPSGAPYWINWATLLAKAAQWAHTMELLELFSLLVNIFGGPRALFGRFFGGLFGHSGPASPQLFARATFSNFEHKCCAFFCIFTLDAMTISWIDTLSL